MPGCPLFLAQYAAVSVTSHCLTCLALRGDFLVLSSLTFLRTPSLEVAASVQQHQPPSTASAEASDILPHHLHVLPKWRPHDPPSLWARRAMLKPGILLSSSCQGADLRFPLLTSVLFGGWWLELGARAVSLSAFFFFGLVQIFLKCFPGLQTAWMSCQGRYSHEQP